MDSYVKVLRKAAVEKAVADLVEERKAASAAGKQVSKTVYRAKLQSLAEVGVQMTTEALQKRVQRRFAAQGPSPPNEISTGSSSQIRVFHHPQILRAVYYHQLPMTTMTLRHLPPTQITVRQREAALLVPRKKTRERKKKSTSNVWLPLLKLMLQN